MEQSLISVLNCLISLIATLINSIEMYMGIQKSMESEMSSSQGFYILSIGIYKMLTLKRENRDINGKQYLMECYNTYSDLVRNSKLIKDPHMLQKDFLQNVNQVIAGVSAIKEDAGGGTDYAILQALGQQQNEANAPSLKEVAMNLFSGELAPHLPPPPPSTDVENNQPYHPTFSLEGSNSHYPLPQLVHQHLPALTQVSHHHHHTYPHQKPTYDPLYSLSRKNIFGVAPRRNTFLEMAGVDLGELPQRERTDSLTTLRHGNVQRNNSAVPPLLSTHHFTTPSQSVTPSPETSRHTTHLSPPLFTEQLQSHLEHLVEEKEEKQHEPTEFLQQPRVEPPAPAPVEQPPLQVQQPPQLQHSKEKGVKEIIHEIESSGRPQKFQ
jgi:hypothetical protein